IAVNVIWATQHFPKFGLASISDIEFGLEGSSSPRLINGIDKRLPLRGVSPTKMSFGMDWNSAERWSVTFLSAQVTYANTAVTPAKTSGAKLPSTQETE